MTTATPLTAADIASAFTGLDRYARIALAVSGGADSTALMHLAADWARSLGLTDRLLVIAVDHGYRADAASEAVTVADNARALGLTAVVQSHAATPGVRFAQSWARNVRYRLLREAARAGIAPSARVALLTAHTEDDQAETLLMRLARGSGIDGLAAIRRVTAIADRIDLVRPLLAFPKARLTATLTARAQPWIEDPSNADPRFERVRIRQQAAALTTLGLTGPPLALSATRAARAADALDHLTIMSMRDPELIAFEPLGYVRVTWSRFMAMPEELRLRVLIKALGWLSPRPVSLGQLEALTLGRHWNLDRLTINTCYVWRRDGDLFIHLERGRQRGTAIRSGEPVALGPFTCTLLDANRTADMSYVLATLDSSGMKMVSVRPVTVNGKSIDFHSIPLLVVRAQPALYDIFEHHGSGMQRRLVSVPTLGYGPKFMSATLPPHPGWPKAAC